MFVCVQNFKAELNRLEKVKTEYVRKNKEQVTKLLPTVRRYIPIRIVHFGRER